MIQATPGDVVHNSDSEVSAANTLRRVAELSTAATIVGSAAVGLRASPDGWQVVAWAPSGTPLPHGLRGEATEVADGSLLVGACDADNAAALRQLIPWLRPKPVVGRGVSFGFGDRLGVATPGHIRALRENPGVAPVFAQQSARELARTGRTYQDVLDAATFGALAAGWAAGYGADADHLKTTVDIDAGVQAGFTMFTADPIALVPDLPADSHPDVVRRAFEMVPWASLEDDPRAFQARYPEVLDADGVSVALPRDRLIVAAARFGAAVAHLATMHRHLLATAGERAVEFEVAVDETAYPTSAVDHVYIVTELRRLGVSWASLAPSFVGRFEKGTDYRGDPAAFAADLAIHAALARALGSYTLSVHSASDKFSIYPTLARESRGAVHLKTSGTSYLEALRTMAEFEPDLLRRIWRVALETYSTSRSSYWVSATIEGLPEPQQLTDNSVASLLDSPSTREILHVAFGAIRGHGDTDPAGREGASLRDELLSMLWAHRETYWSRLATHLGRHLQPFSTSARLAEDGAS